MVWNNQTEQYIKALLEKCQQHQWIHAQSEHYYSKRNTIYTCVALSLTSLTGTLTFATSNNRDNFNINIIMGSVLYVSTVITGFQKFMNYETLTVKHKTIYGKYSELERYVQGQLLLDSELRKDANELQSEISEKLKEITDNMPIVPHSITVEFEKRRNLFADNV